MIRQGGGGQIMRYGAAKNEPASALAVRCWGKEDDI